MRKEIHSRRSQRSRCRERCQKELLCLPILRDRVCRQSYEFRSARHSAKASRLIQGTERSGSQSGQSDERTAEATETIERDPGNVKRRLQNLKDFPFRLSKDI